MALSRPAAMAPMAASIRSTLKYIAGVIDSACWNSRNMCARDRPAATATRAASNSSPRLPLMKRMACRMRKSVGAVTGDRTAPRRLRQSEKRSTMATIRSNSACSIRSAEGSPYSSSAVMRSARRRMCGVSSPQGWEKKPGLPLAVNSRCMAPSQPGSM
ncbi:hypothetical protein M2351_008846 [Azospirillum canadense]|nr:hypothetical protein [Azospirillum canadense]MCW2244185.1 hypothetical protein [Azospirillum canadense]